jgi:hypothetical protein
VTDTTTKDTKGTKHHEDGFGFLERRFAVACQEVFAERLCVRIEKYAKFLTKV